MGTEPAGAHTGAVTGGVLDPRNALHDLRDGRGPGGRAVTALIYPPDAILLVTGLPGAGKTTLLGRVALGDPRVSLLDADRVRERWAARAGRLPYRFYRPFVRMAHYRALAAALLGRHPVVVHDSGRTAFVRRALSRAARRRGGAVHALLLDVPAEEALSGQRARGRSVAAPVFARHRRVWRGLLAELAPWSHPGVVGPPGGFASCVLLDRTSAGRLRRIVFAASPVGVPDPRTPPSPAGRTRARADAVEAERGPVRDADPMAGREAAWGTGWDGDREGDSEGEREAIAEPVREPGGETAWATAWETGRGTEREAVRGRGREGDRKAGREPIREVAWEADGRPPRVGGPPAP